MCLWAFSPPPLTLSKCNSCLTSTCLVFKKCPRHWCQASCQVIPHQGLLCQRSGSCEVSSIVGRHNRSDSLVLWFATLKCTPSASCLARSCLNATTREVVCSGKSFHFLVCFFFSSSGETVAASCHSEWCRRGLFSDFKVGEQREKRMLQNGHCFCRQPWGKEKQTSSLKGTRNFMSAFITTTFSPKVYQVCQQTKPNLHHHPNRS